MSNTSIYHHPIHTIQPSVAKKRGFTIVELLIVVVVIAILAAISVVAYNGIQNRAYDTTVQNDLRQFAQQVELYNAEHGTYPDTAALATLQIRPSRNAYRTIGNNYAYCMSSTQYGIVARSASGKSFYYNSTKGLQVYTWSWTDT